MQPSGKWEISYMEYFLLSLLQDFLFVKDEEYKLFMRKSTFNKSINDLWSIFI